MRKSCVWGDEMQSMKEWALYYAKKGLAVFPLHPRDKNPVPIHGFKDATTDVNKINNWWEQNPNYNIGIATGQASGGLVVIDLDIDEDKGKNGYEVLKEWQREYGELPETWQSITGRGGYHLIYKSSEKESCSSGIYEGVDVRGDGGYIVAPPSVHPNGNRYKWKKSLDEYPLAEVNDLVLSFLHPVKEQQSHAIKPISDTIPEGTRVDTLVKLVCSQVAKGLSDEAIRAAVKAENEIKCVPPLTDEELEKTVFPALKRYQRGTSPYAGKPDSAEKAVLKVDCLADVEATKTEWLWYPYIPLGKVTLLQGDPGMGKTQLSLHIVKVVSVGGEFYNEDLFTPPREPANVIYQTAEDGIADTIKPRLAKMNPDFDRIFYIDDKDMPLSMMDERIEQALQQYKPKLLILDPLQAFLGAGVDMHRANEVRPILSHIGNLAEKYNCAILIVMHMSKMTQATALHRGLGSIDIPAAARSVLVVGSDPADPDVKILAHVKSSLAPHGDSLKWHYDSKKGVVFDGVSDLQADDILNPARVRKKSEKTKTDIAKDLILDALNRTGYATKETIEKIAKDAEISKSTLYDAKKSMGIQNYSPGFSKNKKTWWFMPELTKDDLPLDGEQTKFADP